MVLRPRVQKHHRCSEPRRLSRSHPLNLNLLDLRVRGLALDDFANTASTSQLVHPCGHVGGSAQGSPRGLPC